MQFFGGKERAVEWGETGRSALYARVLAEKEVAHDPKACRKKRLIYALDEVDEVDEIRVLLELTAIEHRGWQRVIKARAVGVPTGTRWVRVSGLTCSTHGEYEIEAWFPNEGPVCGCCALTKILG